MRERASDSPILGLNRQGLIRAATGLAALGVLALGVIASDGVLRTVVAFSWMTLALAWCVFVFPEALIMGYFFAGRFTFEPRLAPAGLPLSINQMMFIGIVLLALIHGRHVLAVLRTWSWAGMLLFTLALVVGMGWTLGPNYGVEKLTRSAGVIVPSVLVTMGLIHRRGTVIPMLAAVFLVGFGLNTVALLTFESSLDHTGRLTGLGSGPNVFSRTVGVSLLVAMMAALHMLQKPDRRARDNGMLLIASAAFMWLLPGVIFAQSRGPVLALLAATMVVVSLSLSGDFRALLGGIAALAFSALAGSWALDNLVAHSRFDLTSESNFDSIGARQGLLVKTWDIVIEHPIFGLGTGGWPVEYWGIDDRKYPHNFFAEIASENGLVVAALVGLLFTFLLVRAIRAWLLINNQAQRSVLMTVTALFVYFLVNIQISGDIIDNRLIWMLLGVMELATAIAIGAPLGGGAAPLMARTRQAVPIAADPLPPPL